MSRAGPAGARRRAVAVRMAVRVAGTLISDVGAAAWMRVSISAAGANWKAPPAMASRTGITKRWFPFDCTVSRAVNVSPGRSGTDGTDILMVAIRPASLARPTSSQGSLLLAWA